MPTPNTVLAVRNRLSMASRSAAIWAAYSARRRAAMGVGAVGTPHPPVHEQSHPRPDREGRNGQYEQKFDQSDSHKRFPLSSEKPADSALSFIAKV